jgi:hypothetical protein
MFVKNVFIVSCSEYNFNKIQKTKKKSDIINPYSIRDKLSEKNRSASEEIVTYNIVKKINNFKKCKFSQFVYYYNTNVSETFIEEIKNIFSNSEYEIIYHLLVDFSISPEV